MNKPVLVPEDRPYKGAVEFNVLCRHLLVGRGDPEMAHASASADTTCPRRVVEVLKSSVVAGTLADPAWAGTLAGYRQIVGAYVESLGSISFFARALSDNAFLKVPPRTPLAVVTVSAVGAVVAEAAPHPITSMTLSAPSVALQKAVVDVIVTNEVARNPASTGFIGKELQRAIAKAVDVSAVATIIAAGTSIPTAGTSAANLSTDIAAAFAAITIGEASRLYFILNAALAASLSARLAGSIGWGLTPTGGTLGGVETVVSSGVPVGNLVLCDASRFAAFSDIITLRASDQTLIQSNTSPDSPPTSSTSFVSLFQTNQTSLQALRFFGISALSTTGSATITGMS